MAPFSMTSSEFELLRASRGFSAIAVPLVRQTADKFGLFTVKLSESEFHAAGAIRQKAFADS